MNICTRCGVNELNPIDEMNSLSRADNETMICDDCGTAEAMEEFSSVEVGPKKHMWYDVLSSVVIERSDYIAAYVTGEEWHVLKSSDGQRIVSAREHDSMLISCQSPIVLDYIYLILDPYGNIAV